MVEAFDERRCLAYDPFAGDFGSPGDRLLADKIVTAAKAHDHCHSCNGPIAKGERHRSRRGCFECTMNTTRPPWAHGLCVYHIAEHVLKAHRAEKVSPPVAARTVPRADCTGCGGFGKADCTWPACPTGDQELPR